MLRPLRGRARLGFVESTCAGPFGVVGTRCSSVLHTPTHSVPAWRSWSFEADLKYEHEDGGVNVLTASMSYHVSDGLSSHRSRTKGPVRMIVVDGEFLG